MTFTRVDLPEFCNPTSVSSISCDQKRLRSQSTKPDHQDIEGYAMGATEVGGHAAAPAGARAKLVLHFPRTTWKTPAFYADIDAGAPSFLHTYTV